MPDLQHAHRHHPQSFGRAFAIGIALNMAFVILEALYGFFADSLALLADAGHNFGDVMGLMVAWGASYLSQWQPTQKHTYGLRRSSIFAALLNALFLLVAIGAIAWEAIRRFHAPVAVQANTIIWVAAVGIVINTATALLFMAGRKQDLNIRSAFLHMVADAAISAGVVVAGLLIAFTGITLIDPIVSLVIAMTIFLGTWSLLRESLNLAVDAVPENIDPEAVQAYLRQLPSVTEVHHVHIWGLSTTDVALTAHVVLAQPDFNNVLLSQIREELHHRYGIAHATIQFETSENNICLTKRCTLHFCRDGKNESER
jgi:cobalt-zinc-cadmium efflux system protein